MAPLNMDGDNLGERHRFYNQLVKEAAANSQELEFTLNEDDDIRNLMKIDIAADEANLDFILDVYKCEDMLLVSRALKRSTWLITDSKYAHIINPNYLYTELFPHMTTRAVNKLLLNIRLHLKDEARVEDFYNHIKMKNSEAAFKWLPNCSIGFIEKEVYECHNQIPEHIIEKLYRRSFSIFEIIVKQTSYVNISSSFLALQYTHEYLDIFEDPKTYGCNFNLNRKISKHLMKTCPERILNNMEKYMHCIDNSILTKYIKERKDLLDILIKKAKDGEGSGFFEPENIHNWIRLLPKENSFDVVRKYVINRDDAKHDDFIDLCANGIENQETIYKLYKYAPFTTAFEDLTKMIRAESSPITRNAMLLVLLTTAGSNEENLRTLLQYYYEKHINTPYKFKIEFINAVLSQTDTHTFDDKTWDILNKLFHSLEVFIKTDNNVEHCVNAIIVRNTIFGIKIPKIIDSKFVFSTLKKYEAKLKNETEKKVVFEYLYNYVNKDIKVEEITTENDFFKSLTSVNRLLKVLNDWNKHLKDYPDILQKISKLIEINKKENYKANLSILYNINKEWRRTMFEVSIQISPSDKVLVNAIKHDAKMLKRFREDLVDIIRDDKILLNQVLRKTRVFWSDTIAKELNDLYLSHIEKDQGYKAIVNGICVLLPHKELHSIIEKYVPTETKIDWNETDERVYNLRKNIAKMLYKARPLVPVDFILLYAKEDYLQYTIPSLCGILSQLSAVKSAQYITKLVDTPVSLQKFGIRYPFQKINTNELVLIATKIWSSTKNSSIKTQLISSIRSRLCQEREKSQIIKVWRLLRELIDDLNCNDNNTRIIYRNLSHVKNIPSEIKSEYIMTVYKFLKSRPPKIRCNIEMKNIKQHLTDVMDSLDDDFVIDYILKEIVEKSQADKLQRPDKDILAAFILCTKNEDAQVRRYKKFLAPLIEAWIAEWTAPSTQKGTKGQNTQSLLKRLPQNFQHITLGKEMNIPYKVFLEIQTQLEENLSVEYNYLFFTYWKLVVELMKLFNENQHLYDLKEKSDRNQTSIEINRVVISSLGEYCAKSLREDIKKYQPSVYILFSRAVKEFREDFQLIFDGVTVNFLQLYKYMLVNAKEIDVYLAVYTLIADDIDYFDNEDTPFIKEIQNILFSHPSPELKMHYYNMFGAEPETTDKSIELF